MMTNDTQITLNQIFSSEELSQERMASVESCKKMSSVRARILKEARVKWPIAFEIIVEKIADILDVSIPGIMVGAWNKYKILVKYADSEKYPPNETFLVPMAEHTVKSEHNPYIEILINGKPVGEINFNITVSLILKGIILKVQGGKVKAINTGTCKGKGTLKCENIVILEKETRSISLPGSIDLGEGIPIVP
jgi:hypothetical protein